MTARGGDDIYLPDDIIIDILNRLPVKSLIRFQCVCKEWRDLFKTPYFIHEHYHHSAHNNKPLLIFKAENVKNRLLRPCLVVAGYNNTKMGTVEVNPLSVTMDSLKHPCRIIGCSKGLVCVSVIPRARDFRLLLLNPASRELRQVPSAYDGGYRWLKHGFGYSDVDRDYKIVSLKENRLFGVYEVKVFSLRTQSWKEVVNIKAIQGVRITSIPVTVNGVIFWNGRNTIVSFDLASEVFTLIPMPPLEVAYWKIRHIAYKNKVAMLHEYGYDRNNILTVPVNADVWVLEYEEKSWTKRCNIGPTLIMSPLCFWRNDELSRETLYSVAINIVLEKFGFSLSTASLENGFSCSESLVSICDTNAY